MPENHILFSSPLPRTNNFYPAACTSLSIAINVPPNGYMGSNCSCYHGTHVWKRFYSLIRNCGCSDPPHTHTTSGEHFFTSIFGSVEWFLNTQQRCTVGCDGEMGNNNEHSAGTALPWMGRECVDTLKSLQLLFTALSQFWRISAFFKWVQHCSSGEQKKGSYYFVTL